VDLTSRAIDHLALSEGDIRGAAVLINPGWDCDWGTDQYFEGHPYLVADVAKWLITAGVILVGIDSLNIDSTDTGERPVHSALLASDIPIVEHLCGLATVPDRGSRFAWRWLWPRAASERESGWAPAGTAILVGEKRAL